jgi:hypothetical protein
MHDCLLIQNAITFVGPDSRTTLRVVRLGDRGLEDRGLEDRGAARAADSFAGGVWDAERRLALWTDSDHFARSGGRATGGSGMRSGRSRAGGQGRVRWRSGRDQRGLEWLTADKTVDGSTSIRVLNQHELPAVFAWALQDERHGRGRVEKRGYWI